MEIMSHSQKLVINQILSSFSAFITLSLITNAWTFIIECVILALHVIQYYKVIQIYITCNF